MFKNFMNNYYYGKSGQGDFEKDDLPRTRLQLFWAMLRVRFFDLVKLNLIYIVVWLPAFYFIFRGIVSVFTLLGGLDDPSLLNMEAVPDAATVSSMLHSVIFYTLLILIPCIAITGPCTAGLCYVTRNWARDEHAFLWSDFKDAVIANWKPALLNSFITGCVPFLVYVAYTFYNDMTVQNFWYTVPKVLVIMVGAIWFMMQLYTYPQMVTYTLNYRGVLHNSLVMCIGRLPQSVLFRLITIVPLLLAAAIAYLFPVNFFIVLVIAGLYYIAIGFALSRFIGASYTNAAFDKYINPRIEGAEVNRGLYLEEDEEADEDEYDDEDDGEDDD